MNDTLTNREGVIKTIETLDKGTPVFMGNTLSGAMKAPTKKNEFYQVAFGIHKSLFKKELQDCLTPIMNSKIFIIVIPDKKHLRKDII